MNPSVPCFPAGRCLPRVRWVLPIQAIQEGHCFLDFQLSRGFLYFPKVLRVLSDPDFQWLRHLRMFQVPHSVHLDLGIPLNLLGPSGRLVPGHHSALLDLDPRLCLGTQCLLEVLGILVHLNLRCLLVALEDRALR